jgi:hypothetical protein
VKFREDRPLAECVPLAFAVNTLPLGLFTIASP